MIRADAASCFDGETASRFTSDGTANLGLDTSTVLSGNFTGSAETLSVIVEKGNAAACTLGIWNASSSAWVFLAQYTFATMTFETLDGAGDSYAYLVRPSTASGGDLHWLRLVASGTAGNTRRAYFFPATQEPAEDDYSTLHYMGWEENGYGSSPLDTSDVAGEQLYYAAAPPPRASAWYYHGLLGAPSTVDGNIWYVGGVTATNPSLSLSVSSGNLVATHHDGSLSRTSTVTGITWGPGVPIEAVVTLDEDGAVHLIACVDSETDEGTLSATATLASAWGGEGALVLMKTTGFLRKHPIQMVVVKLEEMDTLPGTDDPDDVLWEFRRLAARLTPIGDKL